MLCKAKGQRQACLDDHAAVGSVMTPPDQIISVKPDVSPEEARVLLHENRLEKLPIIDDAGHLVGLITAQDLVKHQQNPEATQDGRGRLRVGAAIGVQAKDRDRAAALLAAGTDVLVLDIAHGHAGFTLGRSHYGHTKTSPPWIAIPMARVNWPKPVPMR